MPRVRKAHRATPTEEAAVAKRPQLNFAVTGETLDLIEHLKKTFGVDTNTAVLKRALALARVAAGNQRDDHTVTIVGKDDVRRDILLNG
ncbi:MAG: hypothetical protein WAU78_17715 [Roseiarcus sp.]|jgi:hypothetical protein